MILGLKDPSRLIHILRAPFNAMLGNSEFCQVWDILICTSLEPCCIKDTVIAAD